MDERAGQNFVSEGSTSPFIYAPLSPKVSSPNDTCPHDRSDRTSARLHDHTTAQPRTTALKHALPCPRCDVCLQNYFRGSQQSAKFVDKCWSDSTGIGDPCCECPDGATCDHGTTLGSIEVEEGYYRHSTLSAQVLKCPVKGACAGSKLNGTENGCNVGYDGPLCSRCKDPAEPKTKYYRDSIDSRCVECGGDSGRTLIVPIVLGGVLVIVLCLVAAFWDRLSRFRKRYRDTITTWSNHGTMFIITYQIIINLSRVHKFQGGECASSWRRPQADPSHAPEPSIATSRGNPPHPSTPSPHIPAAPR